MTPMRKRSTVVEIKDADGTEYRHVRAHVSHGVYAMTVKNCRSGQTCEKVDKSPRWALLDALLGAGCSRGVATRAVRNYSEW